MIDPWPKRAGRIAQARGGEKPGLGSFVRQIVDAVYPPGCIICTAPTDTALGLCGSCWRETHFLTGALCTRCGAPVPTAEHQTSNIICDSCDHAPPAWDNGRAAIAYEGAGKRIVMRMKYGDRPDLARPLARWLSGAGSDVLSPNSLIVPVPLHWRRLMARKFNQSAELSKHLGHRLGLEVAPTLLKRTTATPKLSGRREERHAIMHGAIALSQEHGQALAGRKIVLIDDVLASGATLSACAEALRPAEPASIDVLVLARVLRPE